ncbi:MAG: copper amine oxidase N-terminal domain-containing protein [bacterium]|nr:copper amine oxidase N-terminal domain-containing protein [bacterium]
MKSINIMAAVSLVLCMQTTFAENSISVKLNGSEMIFETAPFIEDGTTLVPMRAVFEELGAEVTWNDETRSIVSQKDGITVNMTIDSYDMEVDGRTVTLSKCPNIYNDRTFVPLRAVAEAFGANVEWDRDTGTITIETAETNNTSVPEETVAPNETAVPEPTEAPTPRPTIKPMKAELSAKPIQHGGCPILYVTDTNIRLRYEFEKEVAGEIQECGVRICDKMDSKVKWTKVAAYEEDMIYEQVEPEQTISESLEIAGMDIILSDYGMFLKPDTTYRMQNYVVIDGVEYRGGEYEHRTLATKTAEEILVKEAETRDITSDNAKLYAVTPDTKYHYPVGLYFGESEDDMVKYEDFFNDILVESDSEPKYKQVYSYGAYFYKFDELKRKNLFYNIDLKEHFGITLKPDTTYYWKFYIEWAGEEKSSELMSFTTKSKND